MLRDAGLFFFSFSPGQRETDDRTGSGSRERFSAFFHRRTRRPDVIDEQDRQTFCLFRQTRDERRGDVTRTIITAGLRFRFDDARKPRFTYAKTERLRDSPR